MDLATKSWIFTKLGMPDPRAGEVWWIWEGVFGLQTSLNEGALFGIGQGNVFLFILLSFVALVALLFWLFVAGAARDRLLTVALGGVTAGILGNLYDRLGLPGLRWTYASELHKLGEPVYAVRDWILVMIGSWNWPNFNVADSLLVCGAILLMILSFRQPDRPAAELERQVRAYQPWPGSFLEHDGVRLKVWAAGVLEQAAAPAPGEIILTEGTLGLGTVDGVLRLDEVQPAGKRRMSGAEYRRGKRL